jgi:hypothetical protein
MSKEEVLKAIQEIKGYAPPSEEQTDTEDSGSERIRTLETSSGSVEKNSSENITH